MKMDQFVAELTATRRRQRLALIGALAPFYLAFALGCPHTEPGFGTRTYESILVTGRVIRSAGGGREDMGQTLRRLGLTLPIGTHDQMRKLSYRRSADAGQIVTLTDLYAEAIVKLAERIDRGDEIAFTVQPRGTVRRVSLRLPPAIFEIIKKHAPTCNQSAIVAKSAQQLLQDET